MWDGAQNILNIAWVHAELTLYFLHFPFKGAEVARQSDINIASEWGPLGDRSRSRRRQIDESWLYLIHKDSCCKENKVAWFNLLTDLRD